MLDNSVIYAVFNDISAEQLLMSDNFVMAKIETVIARLTLSFWLSSEEVGRTRSLEKQFAQLRHSDEKNLKLSFSYAERDGILRGRQIVQNANEQSLMLSKDKIATAEIFLPKKFEDTIGV